jgi:TetR/AcrR family transcriptional regulator, transcriptional repressor for nem operon
VIAARAVDTRQMLAGWESASSSPRKRITTFIDILIRNRAAIVRYGCPVGTLCTELAKMEHSARSDANKLFELFRSWLERQFQLLGTVQDPTLLAMQLLARTQGVAVLANAFHDERFLQREVREMHTWLDHRLGSSVTI